MGSTQGGTIQDLDDRRFAALLALEPECVKILDESGRVLQMNPAGIAILEATSPEEVIGQSVFDIIVPEYRERFRESLNRALTSAGATCQIEILTRSGRR